MLNPLPTKVHEHTIKSIQDQFANIVLEREAANIVLANALVPEEKPVVEEEEIKKAQKRQEIIQARREQAQGQASGAATTPGPEATGTSTSGGAGTAAGSSREQMRQRIDEQVANTGILAILSSGSENASGRGGVEDIIGTASNDYQQIFKEIDNLAASGKSVRGKGGTGGQGTRSAVKGQRTTQGGSITDQITGPGSAMTSDLKRTSGFIVSDLAPIASDSEGGEVGGVSAGARDVDEVKRIVQAHTPAIEYCYQREKRRNPDLKGKVVVRFTITPKGTVVDPKIISSTLNSPSVERCILSRISRWDDFGEIDPSLGNATFRQVYSFGF